MNRAEQRYIDGIAKVLMGLREMRAASVPLAEELQRWGRFVPAASACAERLLHSTECADMEKSMERMLDAFHRLVAMKGMLEKNAPETRQ